MKSYDEMAKDVFRRIDEYKTERRERRKKTVRMLIVAACLCVSITVVASGAAAVYYVIQETEPQVVSSETVSEIISSQEPENKEYEVKAYFASGSEEFAGKFKGVQVGGRKSEIAISKNKDAYDRTITKTILGVEEEYSLVSVWSNEYSEQQIIRYHSDEMYKNKYLYIKAETGEIVYYNDIGLYSQQPVDRYVKKDEAIEIAKEYISNFTDDDLSRYDIKTSEGKNSTNHTVSFILSTGGQGLYVAHRVNVKKWGGECYQYEAGKYNNNEMKNVTTDMMDKAIYTAEMKMFDLCKENGILFNYTKKRSVKMVYSAEDGCPVMLVTYSLAEDSPKAARANILFEVKMK